MADLLEEKLKINETELLDEGKFGNFVKAAALGAGLAISPLYADGHELEVAELPADLISSYNELEENPVLNVTVAQAMADEMITKIGEEAVSKAPEETEAWGTAKATYEYLKSRDDKLAIAFLGKFNHAAKKFFGNQIRPTRTESLELPLSDKLIDEVFMQDDSGKFSDEEIANRIVEKAKSLGVNEDSGIAADIALYIAAFYARQSMPVNGMIAWGTRDLKSFIAKLANGKKAAISGTRSVMLGKPFGKQIEWVEQIRDEIKAERRAAEEERRQAYLNSDEYKRSQDPGWTGPRGTWTLGT